MGFIDDLKGLAGEHKDKVADGIDKAGDLVDNQTDGKYSGQVDQAKDFLKSQVGDDQQES